MVAGSGFTLQRPLPTCVGVFRVLSQANPRSHLYSRTPGQYTSGLLIQLCGAQRFRSTHGWTTRLQRPPAQLLINYPRERRDPINSQSMVGCVDF